MRQSFWKGSLVSAGAYAAALLIGFWIDFRITLFSVLALQVTWTLFCIVRVVQLRLAGGHKPGAEPYDRDGYGFALGGSVSSVVLLAFVVVLTQAV